MKSGIILSGLSAFFGLVMMFLIAQNRELKKDIKDRETVIGNQSRALKLLREAETEKLKAIHQKEAELKTLRQEREKDEQDFKQNAAPDFFKWADVPVPLDIIKFMRNRNPVP